MMMTRSSCVVMPLRQARMHPMPRSASSSERPPPGFHLRLDVPSCFSDPVLNLIAVNSFPPFSLCMTEHLIVSNRLLRYSPSLPPPLSIHLLPHTRPFTSHLHYALW